MPNKTDTEPEVAKSGEEEAEQSGKEEIDEPATETIDTPGDGTVDVAGDAEVDTEVDAEVDDSGDKKEESDGVKLPPLVKSAGSSKSSTRSFYLKSPKYSIWDHSNVDSVLTDYGYTPGEARPLGKRPESHERRHTGKKSYSFDDSDVIKAQDTRQSRKEYYLKIYEDIHKLRDYCREEYFEKLEEKVGKQRRNMKKNVAFDSTMGSSHGYLSHGEVTPTNTSYSTVDSSVFSLPHIMESVFESKGSTSSTQLMADVQNKAPKTSDKSVETMRSGKRHYFVSKINRKPKREVFLARNYLKNVPKSDHYKIIQLEEKLRAEGKLKTQADVDEFWCTIRRPEVFKKYFLITEQRPLSHAPVAQTPITMVATLSNPMQQAAQADAPASMKPMDRILDYWLSPTVVNLRDRAGHVTSLGRKTKSLAPPTPATMKKEDDPFHRARKAAAELDQKHPQMGIPHLNCFYMDLEEQQRDPAEALREQRSIKHSKERLLFVKRLHRMYSLANTNLASMQRILEKRKEMDLIPFQAGCAVVSDLIPTQVIHSSSTPEPAESRNQRPWLKYIERKREIDPIQEVSEGGTERGTVERASTLLSTKSDRCLSGDRSVRVHMKDTVPICWESLMKNDHIKVLGATTPSFYWFNYLGAGHKQSLEPDASDIDPHDLFKASTDMAVNRESV